MIINMTTIACRQTHYIDQTLESLSLSDGRDIPVNLILGSYDTSHVEQYRDNVNIVPWDPDTDARARNGSAARSFNVNALRSLKYGAGDYCLCCEDDIRFVKDWLSQLMLTVAEIPDKEYVLSLGQRRGQSPDKRYATHTGSYLCGSQAIFYPSKALRDRVAEYLDEKMTKGMADQLIGKYAKQYAALYNTTPVLIEHIGAVGALTSLRKSRESPTPSQDSVPSGSGDL
jgi:hypothetical protein